MLLPAAKYGEKEEAAGEKDNFEACALEINCGAIVNIDITLHM